MFMNRMDGCPKRTLGDESGPTKWLQRCPGRAPTSQCFAERQDLVSASVNCCDYMTGCWFGTFYIFPYIGNSNHN